MQFYSKLTHTYWYVGRVFRSGLCELLWPWPFEWFLFIFLCDKAGVGVQCSMWCYAIQQTLKGDQPTGHADEWVTQCDALYSLMNSLNNKKQHIFVRRKVILEIYKCKLSAIALFQWTVVMACVLQILSSLLCMPLKRFITAMGIFGNSSVVGLIL